MTNYSVVAVFVLIGLTKKRFGHYAILKILSLRSPRYDNKLETSCPKFPTTFHQIEAEL